MKVGRSGYAGSCGPGMDRSLPKDGRVQQWRKIRLAETDCCFIYFIYSSQSCETGSILMHEMSKLRSS